MIKAIKVFFLKATINLLKPFAVRKAQKRAEKLREEIKRSVRILIGLDKQMSSAGIGRQQRRAFWRDFGQSEANREHVLKTLLSHLKIESSEMEKTEENVK